MVQGQQSCTECQQDQGAHRWTSGTTEGLTPHQLRQDTGGNRQLLPFSGTTDLRRPSVDSHHENHTQEGTPTPLRPTSRSAILSALPTSKNIQDVQTRKSALVFKEFKEFNESFAEADE